MGAQLIRFVVALGVSVFFLWLAFRGLDWPAFSAEMARLSWASVAVYVVSIFVIHLLRTLRWHLMVRALDATQPFGVSLRISFLGFAAVFLVPLRLGELARPLLLKQHRGIGVSAGLGTVAVERTVDGLVMVLVLVLAVLVSGAQDPLLWTMGGVAGAIFGGAALAFGTMAMIPTHAERFWRVVFRPLGTRVADQVIALMHGFIEGLASLPSWSSRGAYLGLTLAYWGLNAWGMAYLAGAMGMELSYVQTCLVMAMLVVGIMLPAGPGSVGTFHWPIIFALTTLFAVSTPQAQAYAITLHLIQVLHMVIVALPFVGDLGAALRRTTPAG